MPRSHSQASLRAGKLWGAAEDALLLEYWNKGMKISLISRLLQRSAGAIHSRLWGKHDIEYWMPRNLGTEAGPETEPETGTMMNTNLSWTEQDDKLLKDLQARKALAHEAKERERVVRQEKLLDLLREALALPEVTTGQHRYTMVEIADTLLAYAGRFAEVLGPQAALQAAGSAKADDLLTKGTPGFVVRSSAVHAIHRAMNANGGSTTRAAAQRALDEMISLGLVTNYARLQHQ